jgi:hypothetical protein
MNPLLPVPTRHAGSRRPVISLILVVVVAGALAPRNACAEPDDASASPSAATRSSPPDFPDAVHLPQGCYISAVVYLERFRAEFPTEYGATLTIAPSVFAGPHTIALVTWKGKWWGRDEHCGIFDLHSAVAEDRSREQLRAAAECALNRFVSRHRKLGRLSASFDLPRGLSKANREEAVATAASLLPYASRIVWVRCGRQDIAFLFFQPAEGTIAVYDPASGTAHAECAATNFSAVVATVATRLGYKVTAVRADPPLSSSALLASSSTTTR